MLVGADPARRTPPPAHASLPGDPQAPLVLVPKDPLAAVLSDPLMQVEPRR
jgi:hypothetical protein